MEKLKGIEHGDGEGEDYKEQYEAAITLISMKLTNISAETAMALHREKIKILDQNRVRKVRINKPKSPNYSEKISHSSDSLSLNLPPDNIPECLRPLVGRWRRPFEKQLTKSDVNVGQCRLSITKRIAQIAVIPLLKRGEDGKKGIPVKVYDSNGHEYPMKYKIWSSRLYVLKDGWIHFKQDHDLRALKDFVKLLVFRRIDTDDLCILITSRRLQVEARG